MLANQSYTLQQSKAQTDHAFVWSAHLRDNTIIHEQPGVSSDALPRGLVHTIEYLPRIQGLPRVSCQIDLDQGERFVRYWTTVWKNQRMSQRLYVLGVEHEGRVALCAFYPRHNKAIFAATRPFHPPWDPHPLHCLPQGTVLTGGPGTKAMGWRHQGFGGELRIEEGALHFRALH